MLYCLVLSCVVLSCLVWSGLILPCFVWSGLVWSCLLWARLVLSCLVLSCLVLATHAVPKFISTRLQPFVFFQPTNQSTNRTLTALEIKHTHTRNPHSFWSFDHLYSVASKLISINIGRLLFFKATRPTCTTKLLKFSVSCPYKHVTPHGDSDWPLRKLVRYIILLHL